MIARILFHCGKDNKGTVLRNPQADGSPGHIQISKQNWEIQAISNQDHLVSTLNWACPQRTSVTLFFKNCNVLEWTYFICSPVSHFPLPGVFSSLGFQIRSPVFFPSTSLAVWSPKQLSLALPGPRMLVLPVFSCSKIPESSTLGFKLCWELLNLYLELSFFYWVLFMYLS